MHVHIVHLRILYMITLCSTSVKFVYEIYITVMVTHRDDSCAPKRDRVAVQLNDHSMYASVWRPRRTVGRLHVHLETVQFGTATGARQQVSTSALKMDALTVESVVMRISHCAAGLCHCQTREANQRSAKT